MANIVSDTYTNNPDGTWSPAKPLNDDKRYNPWRHQRICRLRFIIIVAAVISVIVILSHLI